MSPTIYIVTHYRFNHEGKDRKPLDNRFLNSHRNYIYYLIDPERPKILENKRVLFEREIDPLIYLAGTKHFAEWSFLLAEAKHSFCNYPLFMISSRFYEKNCWLKNDLDQEW